MKTLKNLLLLISTLVILTACGENENVYMDTEDSDSEKVVTEESTQNVTTTVNQETTEPINTTVSPETTEYRTEIENEDSEAISATEPYNTENLMQYFSEVLDDPSDASIKSYILEFENQFKNAQVELLSQLENEKYIIAKIIDPDVYGELDYLVAWEKGNPNGGIVLAGGWEVILPNEYLNEHYLMFDYGTSCVRGIEFYDMSKGGDAIDSDESICLVGNGLYAIQNSSWVIYQEYAEDHPFEMYIEAVGQISLYNLDTHEKRVFREGTDSYAWNMTYLEATNEVELFHLELSDDGSFSNTFIETISLDSDDFILE